MRRLHRRSRRGVALLLAILIVLLLSAALTDFLFRSRVDLDAARNFENLEYAHYVAQSGLELAAFFLKAPGIKPNEWADALLQFAPVPNFGAGGFILDADEYRKTRRQQELDGKVFNDDTPSLTGIDLMTKANYDVDRHDPYGFNNGYLSLNPMEAGLNILDVSKAGDEASGKLETDIWANNMGLELRFVDESSRFNLNALYYCKTGCGPEPTDINIVLYYEIRQLFINELIREPERKKSKFSRREREREEADTSERATEESSRFGDEVEAKDIDNLMCAILDWIDPDDIEGGYENCTEGAERDEYLRGDSPYEPRNGPMESVGELRLIRGMTAEIYRTVAPFLTVYPLDPSGTDCSARLATLRSGVPSGETLTCFDDNVNLMAASDQVIRAWVVGGFNNSDGYGQPDFAMRDNVEFADEVLSLLNCARLPADEQEAAGCKEPAPGTNAPPDCWASSAHVKQVLDTAGMYPISEVGETRNVGASAKQGLNCSAGGGGGGNAGLDGVQRDPGGVGGVANPNQQSYRRLVGDYITVIAIGTYDPLDQEVELDDSSDREDEGFLGEEEEDSPLPSTIESRIEATYFVNSAVTPPELKLLHWQEF